MANRYARIAVVLMIGVIPFLVSGIFIYRNTFPEIEPLFGHPVHLARDFFFASSYIPALGAMLAAFLVQAPFFIRRFNRSSSANQFVHLLSGLAQLLILWVAIVVTEIWVRSIYFGLWDMYVLEFNPMSTSSYFIGITMSIIILLMTFQHLVISKPPNLYESAAVVKVK